MDHLFYVLLGMIGGIIALVGEQAIARYKLRRAAKREALTLQLPGINISITDKQLTELFTEMKDQGISLPPEAEDFLRRRTTVRP